MKLTVKFYTLDRIGKEVGIGEALADRKREAALADACGGSNSHGFLFPTNLLAETTAGLLFDGKDHPIYARAFAFPSSTEGLGIEPASGLTFNSASTVVDRPQYCKSLTISGWKLTEKNNTSNPLRITATAYSGLIKGFNLLFYNRDNRDANGVAQEISRGAEGPYRLTIKVPSQNLNAAAKESSRTFDIVYNQFPTIDMAVPSKPLTSIQVNAYFVDERGYVSQADPQCVVGFTVQRPPSPTPSPTPNINLTSGLIGHWKMDEASWNGTKDEVKDSSTSKNHGTAYPVYKGATTSSGGFYRTGTFDGSDDVVEIEDGLNTTSNTVSFSAWVWRGVGNTNDYILASRDYLSGRASFLFGIDTTNKLNLTVWHELHEGAAKWVVSQDTIPTSQWYHVAAVYSYSNGKATMRVYVNGKETVAVLDSAGAPRWTYSLKNTSAKKYPMGIGRWNKDYPTVGSEFGGHIDDVRIYNRQLTPAEIAALASNKPSAFASSVTPTNTPRPTSTPTRVPTPTPTRVPSPTPTKWVPTGPASPF